MLHPGSFHTARKRSLGELKEERKIIGGHSQIIVYFMANLVAPAITPPKMSELRNKMMRSFFDAWRSSRMIS